MEKKGKEIIEGKRKISLGQFAEEMFPRNENQIPKCRKYYPTGFPTLDEALGGGFSSGLHCLGSITAAMKKNLKTRKKQQESCSIKNALSGIQRMTGRQ